MERGSQGSHPVDLSDEAELFGRAPPSRGGNPIAKAVGIANQVRKVLRPEPNKPSVGVAPR
jgi:hypothetical protein